LLDEAEEVITMSDTSIILTFIPDNQADTRGPNNQCG